MSSPWVPDRRDIIWIECSPQAGNELRDRHALLVLSPRAFNQRTRIVIGLPMTTAASNEANPFAIRFSGLAGKISYILTHQPKSFDWVARKAKPHPWKRVTDEVYALACASLNQIVDLG